jgi:serine/threonine protein kinase
MEEYTREYSNTPDKLHISTRWTVRDYITFDYMSLINADYIQAPELLMGDGTYNSQSDVYALGMVSGRLRGIK